MRIPTGPFADDRAKEAASAFAKIEYASVLDFNRRVMTLSMIGGCAAALAFAFCTPFWSAATRLGLQPFDLLLALLIAKACEWHRNTRNLAPALITAFLCGVGFVESHVFVLLIPLFLAFLLNNRLRLNLAWERQMVLSVAAAAVGALLGLVLLWHVRAIAAADTPAISFRLAVGDLIRDHYQLVLHVLPRADWIWIVVFAFGPALVAVFTAKHSLRNHSFVAYVIHVVLTAVTLSCLFNAPLSPWGLLRLSGILPVMAYVAVAVATGYLVAYWLLLTLPDSSRITASPSTLNKKNAFQQTPSSQTSSSSRATRWVGYTASGMILASICVLPFLNRIEADGRRGEFVDAYAQRVLDAMGSRTWLVTDGWLDNHLKVLAQTTHKTLHLICLQRETDSYHLLEIQHAIDQDPAFTNMRVHLKNMASLSSPAFLQEWLLMDPHAADHVVVFEFGDFWGEAGMVAKPELVLFSGSHEAPQPEAINDLLAAHMRFWDRMDPILNPATPDLPGLVANYRQQLRRHTGFVGNQLGVMLQDVSRPQDAFAVYTRVLRLDPENLSAQFNRYALTLEGTEPNQKEEALKALRNGLTQWGENLNMGLVTRLYGTVRSPQVIANAGLRWLGGGQPGQAELALRRAVTASPGTNGVDYLNGLADLLFLEGKHEQSEATCLEILRMNPGNLPAMLCMMRIEQARGKPEAAKAWLDQLPPQLATDTNVLLEKAIILGALKQHESARKTIQDALDKNPKELRFWLMLITILLNEGKTDEAELVILPKMRVIVQDMPGTEFILYAASGFIEQARGGDHLRHARDNFATAFALRPGNIDFLEKALALDLQLRDTNAIEQHARRVLRANRKNTMANYALGSVLLEHDEVEAARDFLQRSLEIKTTLPALADYAEALRRMGQLAEAERTIRQALAMDEHSAPALKTLATILLDAKRPNEAATAAKQAVSLVASNAFLQTTYVRCLVAQGHADEARKELAGLLQTGTNLPPVLYTQVQALSKQVDAH